MNVTSRSLIVLPQINVVTSIDSKSLNRPSYKSKPTVIESSLVFFWQTSKPMIAISAIILFTALYKLVHFLQSIIKQLQDEDDVYACDTHMLNVPTSKTFPFKVTKMVVDETDVLVSAYVNGSVYVWDLYSDTCSYYINRR